MTTIRHFLLFYVLLACVPAILPDSKLLLTKTIINLCSPGSCGPSGVCVTHAHGARCKCAAGWTGIGCQRPCQDIYRACDRWLEERRCVWARPYSAFFMDNCPLTCGVCRPLPDQQVLPIPLPPLLEPLAWLIGRWKTKTVGKRSDRFPAPLSNGPYTEILDIQPSDVPAFDRPPLNVTVRAWNGIEEHVELGFMTVKPAHEDTGFVEPAHRTPHGRDMVALEMVSNTGCMTIEEGELEVPGSVLAMRTSWHRVYHPLTMTNDENRIQLATVQRTFRLLDSNTLEERLDYAFEGQPAEARKRVSKRFRRVRDYLSAM